MCPAPRPVWHTGGNLPEDSLESVNLCRAIEWANFKDMFQRAHRLVITLHTFVSCVPLNHTPTQAPQWCTASPPLSVLHVSLCVLAVSEPERPLLNHFHHGAAKGGGTLDGRCPGQGCCCCCRCESVRVEKEVEFVCFQRRINLLIRADGIPIRLSVPIHARGIHNTPVASEAVVIRSASSKEQAEPKNNRAHKLAHTYFVCTNKNKMHMPFFPTVGRMAHHRLAGRTVFFCRTMASSEKRCGTSCTTSPQGRRFRRLTLLEGGFFFLVIFAPVAWRWSGYGRWMTDWFVRACVGRGITRGLIYSDDVEVGHVDTVTTVL